MNTGKIYDAAVTQNIFLYVQNKLSGIRCSFYHFWGKFLYILFKEKENLFLANIAFIENINLFYWVNVKLVQCLE